MPTLARISRILKKLLTRVVLPFAGLLILFISAGIMWINSDSGKNWVQARVNDLIPGTLVIGGQRLSLFSPAIDLEQVTLKDANGKALAGFSRFSIRLAVFPLLKKEIRITQLILNDPWADLIMDEAGLTLVQALVDPNAETDAAKAPDDGDFSMPVNITCQELYIGKGRFTVDLPAENLHFVAQGLAITADGDFAARKGSLAIQVERADFKQGDISPHPIHLRLNARMDGNQLAISDLFVKTGQTALDFMAIADEINSGDPQLDGRLTLDADLAELAAVLGLEGGYTGALAAAVSITGKAGNPTATLTTALSTGQLAGWAMDTATLEIHLDDRQIAIRPVEWKLADGGLRLDGTLDLRETFPSGFLSSDFYLDRAVYDLILNSAIPRLKPWLAPVLPMDGVLEAHASLSGKGIAPDTADAKFFLELKGKDILAPGMNHPVRNQDLSLGIHLARGTLALSRLDAVTDDLSLSGKGHFQMADQSFSAALALDTEDISRSLAMAGLPSAKGAVHIALDAAGSPDRPDASVTINARGLGIAPYTVGDLDLSAALTPDGRIQIERMGIANGQAKIEGSGRLRLRLAQGDLDPDFDTSLDLRLSQVTLRPFMPAPPVDGVLNGNLRITGPLSNLVARLALDGKGLKKETLPIGDLDAALRLEKGMVYADRLNLKNGDTTVAITGTSQILRPGRAEVEKNPAIDLSARVKQFDPGVFTPTVKGVFNLDAVLTGTMADPSGKLTLAGTRLDVAGQLLPSANLSARFKDKRIWLDALTISVADDEAISATGWMGLDKRFSAQLKTPGISLAHIQPLQAQVPAKGRLALDVRADGSLDAPSANGRLTLSGIRFNDAEMKDIRLDLSLHNAVARITGDLNFSIESQYHLEKGDFSASIRFDQTETAPWFQLLGQPEISGTLSGNIDAAGNANRPAEASVKLDIRDLSLFFMDKPLARSDRIAFQLENKALSIPDQTITLLSTGHLRMSGNARLGKEDPMDGSITAAVAADLPISAAALFSPELASARGALVLDGTLSGPIKQPSVNARLDLDHISMAVPGLEQHLNDLSGGIRVTDSAIVVDAISGKLDTGTFKINGQIGHQAFRATTVNLTLGANAIPIEVPEMMNALISTDIRVMGKDGTAGVRGEVVLMEGSYYKDIRLNLLKMATTRQRAVSPASPPTTIPWFDTVGLNIGISYRQPFLVENNMASMEIHPDLKIGGTLAIPIVSGRAQINNGTVYFQRRPFAIKRGVIDFVNPYKTVPEIAIESVAVIRDRTITLAIEGPPDNLKVKLSSVPEETDSDILSLILFGQTAKSLTSGDGSAKRTTTQMMTEMIADTFSDDIKKHTGLDIIKVDAVDGETESDSDIRVTVGKHLSRRMTVKYAVESKTTTVTQRAIAEYKMLENFMLSGFQDTEGVYGAELVFRIEFR